MRKRLKTIIFFVFIILLIVVMTIGIKIGSFQILSISELKEKNNQLDEKILEASTLSSVNYPDTIDTLETTYENYKIQKQKYEEISDFTGADKKQIYETKQYDIGYLWEIIGKYCTTYNLTISMDVQSGSGQNLYNLSFNVSGQYVNISQFIANLENNSDLSFRIYNFKMSGSSETVTSSFLVKDVNIDPDTLTKTTNVVKPESGTVVE